MKPLIYFAILLIFNMSCNQKPSQISENNVKSIEVENSNVNNVFDISKVYSNGIKIISLKSSNGFILAGIDKIEYYQDHFFMLDQEHTKRLFVYDKQGNPITSIKSISDFSIGRNRLFLLNEMQDTIKVFLIPTMKLEKSIKLKLTNISEIAYAGENILCYRQSGITSNKNDINSSTLFLIDQSGEVLKNWLPLTNSDQYLKFFSSYPSLRSTEKNIYLSRMLWNDLFSFDMSTSIISKRFHIEFDSLSVPFTLKDLGEKSQFEYYDILDSKNYNYNLGGYLENKSYVFFSIATNDSSTKTVLFDKVNNNSRTYNTFRYANTNFPIISLKTIKESYGISVIPLELITSIRQQIDFEKAQKNDFIEFVKNFDVKNGNPAILLMY